MMRSTTGLGRQIGHLLMTLMIMVGAGAHASAQEEKPSIAVMEPEYIAVTNMRPQQLKELGVFIQRDIEASLREIRIFDVFARDDNATLAQKLELVRGTQDGYVDTQGLMQGGSPLVSYIVLPEIRVVSLDRQMRSPAPGAWIAKDQGFVELSIRVLDVGSGQVSSTTWRRIEAQGDIVKIPRERPTAQDRLVDPRMTSDLSRAVGGYVAQETSFKVFPPSVVAFANNEVYIDVGQASGLKKGEIVELFVPGKDIVVRGVVVGTTEKYVGKARIDRFQAQLTIAKVIEAEGSDFDGALVRRAEAE